MPRLLGVDIPDNKRIEVALTYVYGVGPVKSVEILKQAGIDLNLRAKDLTSQDLAKIQKILDEYKTEGDLRKEIRENIQRLKRINSYRGLRHTQNLPVRGQRTKVNARTKRGKRKTIGALTKEAAQKIDEARK